MTIRLECTTVDITPAMLPELLEDAARALRTGRVCFVSELLKANVWVLTEDERTA